MTCRNAAPFLHETLQAIKSQSYRHWELMITNNQSTDNSLSIIEKYAADDNRIKVFTNPGLAEIIPGLQYAFSKSKGQLITRMDADDIMPDNKLMYMANTLMTHGPGHLSSGCIKHFSADKLGEGFKNYDQWLNELMINGHNYREIYRECVVPSSCWMVYRQDFIKCGGFGRLVYPEDYDLCFRFYALGLKIIGSKEILHFWRDHPARISRTDRRYADQLYYDLKLYYFQKLDWQKDHQVVLWGAGKKGKKLGAKLVALNIPFRWVCNNANKIGHNIYGINLEATSAVREVKTAQVLIAVSAKEKSSISEFLQNMKINYYWFC